MSSLIIKCVRISNIEEHPNADRLDIATVGGWRCVVGKDQYKKDDLVVFVPPDAVLPDDLVKALGVETFLRSGNRVSTAKIRGLISQGLCIHPSLLDHVEEGEDVADKLGITKYDPPITNSGSKTAVSPEWFEKYRDIENIKNFHEVIPLGTKVTVTEKIHGTNFRCSKKFGEFVVGSRNLATREGLYNKIAALYKLQDIEDDTTVYGEIYGASIQKLKYDLKTPDLIIFEVYVKGFMLSYEEMRYWALAKGLKVVPIVYEGPWDGVSRAQGQSLIASHIREGVVIESMYGKYKDINPDYLLKNYEEIYTH